MTVSFLSSSVLSQKSDMGGWEIDGEYNKNFNADEFDSFRGNIVGITKVVPLPGMSPGIALLLGIAGGEVITVHVCPLWFENPGNIGVRNGDRVKVRGAWAEINGEEVFMLSKLKKGNDFEYKVRLTKDGTPLWTMPPEELERERNSE